MFWWPREVVWSFPNYVLAWHDLEAHFMILGDLQIITGCHFDTEGSHAVNRRSPWKPIWRLPSSWLSFLCMFLCSSSSFSDSVLPNSQDSCKAIISFLHLRRRGPLRRASDTISIVRNGHNSTACPQAGYHGQRSFSTAKVYHRAASPASTWYQWPTASPAPTDVESQRHTSRANTLDREYWNKRHRNPNQIPEWGERSRAPFLERNNLTRHWFTSLTQQQHHHHCKSKDNPKNQPCIHRRSHHNRHNHTRSRLLPPLLVHPPWTTISSAPNPILRPRPLQPIPPHPGTRN